MKQKLISAILLLFLAAQLHAQDSLNMTLLGRWDDDTLPIAGPGGINSQYSGCWGMALNGHEFAILGGARHVLIFDVTVPSQPQLIGKFEGQTNTVWREFKSYEGRFYAVSDATSEGMMIFDMRQAPDTVIRTYYSNQIFRSSHTITLDTTSGRIYLNGSNAMPNGLVILDVKNNPDNPQVLSFIDLDANGAGGYVHDSYVRGDTVYASSGFEGLFALDCTQFDTCVLLAQFNTGGYNHNSWASADGRYIYYTEEIPDGRPVQIVDVGDLSGGIEGAGNFLDQLIVDTGLFYQAVPHNVYIKDNLLFNSQYEDGLQVYDISDPENPLRAAYYDTHPQNTQYNLYRGNWGNYPWLPSGTIIAGDMQNGLYLLKLQTSSSSQTPAANRTRVQLAPNPASEHLRVSLSGGVFDETAVLHIYDAQGKMVLRMAGLRTNTLDIPLAGWPQGLYFLHLQNADGAVSEGKFIVRH